MSAPIATLPMYDRPDVRAATDALWDYLAAALKRAGVRDVPAALTRSGDHIAEWERDTLLFTECCGYDAHFLYADRFTPLAAPVSRAPGCAGAEYRTLLVVPAESPARALIDCRGKVAAYNEPTSHSGRVALATVVAPLAEAGRFFSGLVETGAHERSLEVLAEGAADVTGVDCVTFALIARDRPALAERVRVIGETALCPAPPFVAGPAADATARDTLRAALLAAGDDPALADVRDALLLDGIAPVERGAYARCAALVVEASRLGYDLLEDTD